jgi:TRAP-type C4-dicarboxylate transport system permease small subunit
MTRGARKETQAARRGRLPERAADLAGTLGVALLLVLLLMTCAAFGLRPFGLAWRGAVEAGGYVCAAAVGLCMPLSQFAGSHITGGLWADRLPRKARRVTGIAVSLICAALLGAAGLEVLGIAVYIRQSGELMEGFPFSSAGMAAVLAFGLLGQGCAVIFQALRAGPERGGRME